MFIFIIEHKVVNLRSYFQIDKATVTTEVSQISNLYN